MKEKKQTTNVFSPIVVQRLRPYRELAPLPSVGRELAKQVRDRVLDRIRLRTIAAQKKFDLAQKRIKRILAERIAIYRAIPELQKKATESVWVDDFPLEPEASSVEAFHRKEEELRDKDREWMAHFENWRRAKRELEWLQTLHCRALRIYYSHILNTFHGSEKDMVFPSCQPRIPVVSAP